MMAWGSPFLETIIVVRAGMRLREPVPGVVKGAQTLGWGLESYDSVVDMEETAGATGGGGRQDVWRCRLAEAPGENV